MCDAVPSISEIHFKATAAGPGKAVFVELGTAGQREGGAHGGREGCPTWANAPMHRSWKTLFRFSVVRREGDGPKWLSR